MVTYYINRYDCGWYLYGITKMRTNITKHYNNNIGKGHIVLFILWVYAKTW